MAAARLRFGLIGSGYMGRAHAIALQSAAAAFGADYAVECATLADVTLEQAKRAAESLGFAAATADWRAIVADPRIDVVDICTPNHLHAEMALAAIAAGKHVYCEKPLALDMREAATIVEAARRAKVCNVIGFNYICNPMVQVAREMIAAGELGEVVGFRGSYLEDYMSDPAVPYSWRCRRKLAGAGALADLGSHLINMGHFLLGPIARVNANLRTVHRATRRARQRRAPPGRERRHRASAGRVRLGRRRHVGDQPHRHGLQVRARGGGSWHARHAAVRPGAHERAEVLQLDDAAGRRGFRTILAGPEHPDYAAFCPAPGHGLGINDLKVIEVRNLIRGIREGGAAAPDFEEGLRVQQVMDAMEVAAQQRSWIDVDQVAAT